MSLNRPLQGFRALQNRLADAMFDYGEAPFGAPGNARLVRDIDAARKALDRRMSDLMVAAQRVSRASMGKYGAADLVRALEAFEACAPKAKRKKP